MELLNRQHVGAGRRNCVGPARQRRVAVEQFVGGFQRRIARIVHLHDPHLAYIVPVQGSSHMKRTIIGTTCAAVAVGAILVGTHSARVTGQGYVPSTKNGDWTHYTADAKGTKYSPLDQINGQNFKELEVAWRFKTDNLGPRPEYKLEGTPLAIRGILYTTAGTRRSVIALDGQTGELIWSHSYREGNRASIAPRQLSGRGVAYWTDGKGDERVVYVTTGYRLIELN